MTPTSWAWGVGLCFAEAIVLTAAKSGTAHATGASSAASYTMSAFVGTIVPLGVSTGVRRTDGKARLNLSGNVVVRRVDELILEQSLANNSRKVAEHAQLLLHRRAIGSGPRFAHPSFDDYMRFLQMTGAKDEDLAKVRDIANDSSELDMRLATLLAFVAEKRHWAYYRDQVNDARRQRDEGTRSTPHE